MDWDYFISHASEDKPLIVTPFAHYLGAAEFTVRQKSNAAAAESGLRVAIASYDRLLDDRKSIYGH